MNTAAAVEVIPTVPGTAFAGGLYVDRLVIGAQVFVLVSAGAAGELRDVAWNASSKSVDGARSYNDGLANTEAMAAAGSELAKAARACRIGGFDDWYLPSRMEALMQRCALHPALADSPDAFEEEWYWTSTQRESVSACAWVQSFGWGHQSYGLKSLQLRARFVRSIPI